MKKESSGELNLPEEKAGAVNLGDKVFRLVHRFTNLLALFGGQIAAWSLVSLVILSVVEITGRRVFIWSTGCSEEVSGYLLVSITYMAIAYVFIKGGHLTVEVVTGKLGPMGRKGFDLFRGVVGLTFCGLIAWYGLVTTMDSFRLGSRSPGNLHAPLAYTHILVPIGMTILGLVMLVYLIGAIKSSVISEKRTAQSDSAKGGQQ